MTEYFSGRVHSVIFEDAFKSFYIVKIVLDKEKKNDDDGLESLGFEMPNLFESLVGKTVVAKGQIPGLDVRDGVWFGFEGEWHNHKTHGKQIKIKKAPVFNGISPRAATSLLISKDVSRVVCERLQEFFKENYLDALSDVEILVTAPFVTQMEAELINQRWNSARAYFQTLEFLVDVGIPNGKIRDVWSTFGDDTEEVLSQNPWALTQIDGIPFDVLDHAAEKLGLDMMSPNRIRGCILYCAKESRGMGHLYVTTRNLINRVSAVIPQADSRQIAQALGVLHGEGLLIVDKKTRQGTTAIYESWFHTIEQGSADFLFRRKKFATSKRDMEFSVYAEKIKTTAGPGLTFDEAVRKVIDSWSTLSGMELAKQQYNGIYNALTQPVSILTGLPGTGKSSSLKVLIRILQDVEIPFLMVAPTGIAAKRMMAITGSPAYTVHRAFQAGALVKESKRPANYEGVTGKASSSLRDGSREEWGFGPGNPHPARVVIVDEASMVDQNLLYRILTCTHATCRLVFVGDAAQLPSVGPGNVLRDLIRSGCFPTSSLTEIFRQKNTSDIVYAAHSIHAGITPKTQPPSEFTLVELSTEKKVLETILKLAEKLYAKKKNFQILSPRHAGTVGVTNLNVRLRELLNPRQPGAREVKIGSRVVREGDRIMVVRNNYDLEVYNGDVGKVSYVDRSNRRLKVKIYDTPAKYVFFSFSDVVRHLRLAYATTIHKCVHPNTLVETKEGLLPIKDIQPSGNIATHVGVEKYGGYISNPPGVALCIKTKDGYHITVTPEHGVDVWTSSGYQRKQACKVVEGDFFRVRLGVSVEPEKKVSLPPIPLDIDVRARIFAIPQEMTEDLAEFLGLMVADGTLYKRGFRLAKRHEDVADRFAELCGVLFGVSPKRFFTFGAHHVEVNSVFLASWLFSVGGLNPKSKDVPGCILRSPSKYHVKFIRGVFADSTVNVKEGVLDHIELTAKSPILEQKIRTMLLRLGIFGGSKRVELPNIVLYGFNAVLYFERVGFVSKYKTDKCRFSSYRNSMNYSIPIMKDEVRVLWDAVRDSGEINKNSLRGNGSHRGSIGRTLAEKVLSLVHNGSEAQAILIERLQYHHTRVSSIEKTTAPSMCVRVPGSGRFLQNGFPHYNSQGLEFDIIVMPLVPSFGRQLQRNLLYTGITRAKKKAIILGNMVALERAILNNQEDLRNTLFVDRLQQAFSSEQ